jgi:hypothetical protein
MGVHDVPDKRASEHTSMGLARFCFVQLFGLQLHNKVQLQLQISWLLAAITVAASLQPLSGELTKFCFNWPLKILWLMILVSFLLVPWFPLSASVSS